MNSLVTNFIENDLNKLISDYEKFCFMARSKSYQLDTIKRLQKLHVKALKTKEEMIKISDEDSANAMLSLEETISTFIHELQMWVELKNNKPNNAWSHLVDAQMSAETAMQVHPIAGHLIRYSQKLNLLEKLLFPPQNFASSEIVYGKSECSICGQEYGICEHIKGKAYMGQQCCQIIREIKAFRGAALVKNPSSKHCRILTFTDNKSSRDFMTWNIIPKFSFKTLINKVWGVWIYIYKIIKRK